MEFSGKYDKRVDILRDTGTETNAAGEHLENWIVLVRRWAKLSAFSSTAFGKESVQADQSHTVGYSAIRLQYEAGMDLTAKDRIRYTNPKTGRVHLYEINAIDDVNQAHEEWFLRCTELL